MNRINRIIILSLVLLFTLGAVSATDINDTTDVAVATEEASTQIIDNANDINGINEENELETTNSLTVTNTVYNDDEFDLSDAISTYDEIIFDGTFSETTITLDNPVNITATSTTTFTNTQFVITSSNVNISNINVANTNLDGSVISASGVTGLNISNNTITTTNTHTAETMGITLYNVNESTVSDNVITISGVPQSMGWEVIDGNWVGAIQVSGLWIKTCNLINATNNTITETNSVTPTDTYSTIEAVTVKAGSKYINVSYNTIYSEGSYYVYGISLSGDVKYSTIDHNYVNLTGNNFISCIQLDATNYTNVTNNTVVGYCNTTDTTIPSVKSAAYGVVITTNNYYATGPESANITVKENIVKLNSTVAVGIEAVFTENNTIDNNTVVVQGNVVTGIGLHNGTNNALTNNIVIVSGNTIDITGFYDIVGVETTGIKLNGTVVTTNNNITGNHIYVEDANPATSQTEEEEDGETIIITNIEMYAVVNDGGLNTVTGNYMTAGSKTGNLARGGTGTYTTPASNTAFDLTVSDFFVIISQNTIQKNINKQIKNNILGDSLPNIILTSLNFDTYITNNQFNDLISDGDTIDIQGKFNSTRFNLTINKAVNIISSTHDAYINLHSLLATSGKNDVLFKIDSNGSGTNITGITFENTRISIENTSNININNCTVTADTIVGSGAGMFSVRNGSNNINITNNYFEKTSGQHSNVVFAGATNVIFENNTIIGKGNVGNLFYLTTYNTGVEYDMYCNRNYTIKNNYIDGTNATVAEICYGIALEGANIVLDNNTLLYGGKNIIRQWSGIDPVNVTITNNYMPNGTIAISFPNSTIANNTFNEGVYLANSNFYNNTFSNITISGNTTLEGNNIRNGNVTILGDNITLNNNTISGCDSNYTINIPNNITNVTVTNNHLASILGRGEETINGTPTINENNTNTTLYVYITDNNIDKFNKNSNTSSQLWLNENIIKDDDWINIKLDKSNKTNELAIIRNLTFFNMTYKDINIMSQISQGNTILVLNNCYLPNLCVNSTGDVTLINSTIGTFTKPYVSSVNNISLDENSYVLNSTGNNTYTFFYKNAADTFLGVSNRLIYSIVNITDVPCVFTYIDRIANPTNPVSITYYYTVNDSSILNVFYVNYTSAKMNNTGLVVDKNVSLIGLKDFGIFDNKITFGEYSDGCLIENLTMYDDVYINDTTNILFKNTIFYGQMYITNSKNITIENCSFYYNDGNESVDGAKLSDGDEPINANILINESTEVQIINTTIISSLIPVNVVNSSNCIIQDNLINTTNDFTVIFDEKSTNNNLTNNYLYNNNTQDIATVKLGNNNYEETLQIYPVNITITVNNSTGIHVGDNVPITVTVNNTNNNTSVNTGYIEIYADSILQNTINITNGTINTNITFNRAILSTNITVYYYSNETYLNNSTNYEGITVNTASTTIVTSNIQAKYGNNITLTAKINSTTSNIAINEGYVLFSIGTLNYNATVKNGTATINATINDTWLDNKRLRATYVGVNYGSSSLTVNVTISMKSVNITANNVQGEINKNTTLKATIKDEDGNNVTDGNVSFTNSNGTTLANVKVINGTATANIIFNTTYNDNITATYNGTKYYQSNSTTFTVTTGKLNSTITVDNVRGVVLSRVTLVARVVDENGNNVTGGTVGFKINGVTLRYTNGTIVTATLVNGVARVNYTIPQGWLATGTTIMATYTGNSYVNSARSNNSSVTISRLNSSVSILTDKVTCKTGETMIIKVLVTDTDGKLVNGGQVAFKLNGLTLKDSKGKTIYVNVTNGVATLNYTIPILYGAYNYTLTAVYGGSVYSRATDTSSVELIKTNTHVDANPIKTASNKVTINARVLDGNNKQILRATTITLKLNGITYKNNITANNGILNITLDFPYKTGTYELLIIAGENSQYQSSRLTTTIQRT